MPPTAFDDVVESVRAALNAKRGEANARITGIQAALHAYERALELEIAESYAAEHGLKKPPRGESAVDAARKLLRVVSALPELQESARPAKVSEAPEPPPSPAPKPRAPQGKVVIIGALSGREKSTTLPHDLDAEWIDTERDGVHAVGNLPQRIRQGRVEGVVILDRIVSHKHTEPVVAAAREARVPVVFAGQGGKASLARALEQLELMRRERA